MSTDNLLIRNIYIFCLLHTGNQTDAENLAVQAIATANRSGQEFPLQDAHGQPHNFEAIFPRLLQMIDQFRQRQRDFLNIEDSATLLSSSNPEQDWLPGTPNPWETIVQALQFLPHRQEIVIVLRLFCGMDRFSIARLLSVPPGVVTSNLITGLQELRCRIEGQEPDISNNPLTDEQIDAFDSFLADQDSPSGDLLIDEAVLAGSLLQMGKAIHVGSGFQKQLSSLIEKPSSISKEEQASSSSRRNFWRGWIVFGGVLILILIIGAGLLLSRQALPSSDNQNGAIPPEMTAAVSTATTDDDPEAASQAENFTNLTEVSFPVTGVSLSDLPRTIQFSLETALPSSTGALKSYALSSTGVSGDLIRSYQEQFTEGAQQFVIRSGDGQSNRVLLMNGENWIMINQSSGWVTIQPTVGGPSRGFPDLSLRIPENAWKAIQQRDGSAWISFPDENSLWAGTRWERTYPSGEHFDVYGKIEVYDPVKPGTAPLILLNSLVVQGDPGGFRSQAQTGEWIHAWGTIQPASSNQPSALILKGFESSPLPLIEVSGKIFRQKDAVQFVSDDGMTYILPDVPSEVPDGIHCSISGVVMGSTQKEFNWSQIVPNPISSDTTDPVRQVTISGLSFAIEQVRVIYLNGSGPSVDKKALLSPFWEFSGHSSDGLFFKILISANQE